MNKETMNKEKILDLYLKNKDKGKYWVARTLGLKANSVSSLIDKHIPNSLDINKDLENQILNTIEKFPYTGSLHKISKYLGVSSHRIKQIILKTNNQTIKSHFNTPKHSSHNLTDQDIQDILEGSKKGIGNDLMGSLKNIDGVCIRNIRKKFLSKEEYEKYHSVERFYSGDYNSYYNDRGDKFLSTWEEKVADYLFNKNIKYFSNIRIYYKEKNYSPDFYLPKTRVFIEVFGMSSVEYYKNRMEEKMKFYKKNNIKYLALLTEDFMLSGKFTDTFKYKIDNFINEVGTKIFNNHIKKIYIHKL